MFPSEAEPLDLGSQAPAWKLIFKLLVTRREPSNADPEALPPCFQTRQSL